jgi:ubiquinone/menaquinone biosynthesis C-methylase UbiE
VEPETGDGRATRSQGYVDYERHGALYRQGRALPAEVLDRWGDAVSAYLPAGPLRVADIGAGTGIFAKAWPRWAEAGVIAVEPAASMVAQCDGRQAGVRFVYGIAEALPVTDGSVDVVWVSTALHHFADVDRALDEFFRVLRGGGRVLVRTYIPGRTQFTYLDEFPGRSKWARRFHDEDRLLHLFDRHGFGLVDVRDVLERTETYAQSAEWASLMRDGDSILTALDDADIAAGLAALWSSPERVGRLELTLLAFEHP